MCFSLCSGYKDYVYTHYLRLGLHVQIRLYYVLPYKAKISAQHGIGFILDRCIVYLELTMPNLQKKCQLNFEIFNIKKCTLFFGTEYISSTRHFCDKIEAYIRGLETLGKKQESYFVGSRNDRQPTGGSQEKLSAHQQTSNLAT